MKSILRRRSESLNNEEDQRGMEKKLKKLVPDDATRSRGINLSIGTLQPSVDAVFEERKGDKSFA